MNPNNININGRRTTTSTTPISIAEVANYADKKVSLIGIVVEFSFPIKTNGTDYFSVLRIVDQSQSQQQQLSVLVFTKKAEHLPVVKSHGDVILLQNVTIKQFREEVNVVFNKKFSSFGLFEGSYANRISCYQTLGSFSLSLSERNYINNLRNWWPSAHIGLGTNEHLISINDIKKDVCFDLVCQVLHVSYDVFRGLWILFVWDGTDAPLLSLDLKLQDEEKDPLPLQVESVPISRDTFRSFHRVGTILRVMAYERHENIGLQFPSIGKWVRIRKMSVKELAGMWYGVLHHISRVRLLADNDSIVVDYKRKFRERKSEHDRLPLWSFDHSLTEIEYDDMRESVQFMTLMDVLAREKDDNLFYCVVRVVAMSSFDKSEEQMIRLTLEDPTARIHAYLLGEDLVKFMNGFSADVVIEKMKRLLGVPEHEKRINGDCTRFPPFVKCCIDTTKEDDNEDIFYICRTRLI